MMTIQSLLKRATDDAAALLPKVADLHVQLDELAREMIDCWGRGGKVLTAGNGGSACDAMHLAEELVARFQKNRRALAAISLTDSSLITCAGNDFGFENIFARQVEALAKKEDILIVFTTSGNSENLLRAVSSAKTLGTKTVSFLGKDGGKLKGVCDIELHVPAPTSHRTQEAHLLLYHTLCEWIDAKIS